MKMRLLKRSIDYDDLNIFIDALKTDKDLNWARKQHEFQNMQKDLKNLLDGMQRPNS